MDELVERIVRILIERQNKTLSVSCSKFDPKARNVLDFAYHQRIYLMNIDIIQLVKLAKLDDLDPITVWLLKGIEHGCDIILRLCFSSICLIPTELFEWPIVLENSQGKRLRVFKQRIITYSEVALLTKNDVLIRLDHQQLTGLAEERLKKNQIQIIAR